MGSKVEAAIRMRDTGATWQAIADTLGWATSAGPLNAVARHTARTGASTGAGRPSTPPEPVHPATAAPVACAGDDRFVLDRNQLTTADFRSMTRVCASCPALQACRAYAKANRERTGFWAGQHRQPDPNQTGRAQEVAA